MPLTSPRLFDHPFLYLGGDGEYPPLSPAEVEALRRYLTFGGFLLADANDGSSGRGFDASFRRDLARVLPGAPLEPVPAAHVVFKSFFLLDSAPGRLFLHPGEVADAYGLAGTELEPEEVLERPRQARAPLGGRHSRERRVIHEDRAR